VSSAFDLSVFFDLSPDLLCISGFDGYFKKVNASMMHLLGHPEEILYQRPISSFIHPEDQAFTDEQRDALCQGLPLLNFENRYLTREGKIIWLTWTSTPLPDQKLIYAIAKNITHKKKLEADRNRLITNMTQAHQELKQLSYTSSHDLRGPVNNLLSLFSLLDEEHIKDRKTRELFAIFEQATQSLKANIDHYTDLLKGNQGQQQETISLEGVLENVLQDIESLIKESGAIVEIDIEKCPVIYFNPIYLKSIFLNLITNALKYAHPDKVPVISIRSERTDEGSQVSIQDNGLGFDMEAVKDKIFGFGEKFHNHQDSKGIGLYLVHNHMISLGGKVRLESKPYAGACFSLIFPEQVLR
jgi:PAS domain S-box-containing protein